MEPKQSQQMMDHFSAQTEEPWLLFLLVLFGEDSQLVKSLHQNWKKNLRTAMSKHPEILNSASSWMLPYFSAWQCVNPTKPMKLVPLHREKMLLEATAQNPSLPQFLFLSFLHHWLHYSIADIAAITGLSSGTIEVRLEKLGRDCHILKFETFWKEKTHAALESLKELTSVGLLSPYFLGTPGKAGKFHHTNRPWFLRPLFEGILTAALLFGIITSGPRMKVLYEIWLEKRLNFSELSEWSHDNDPSGSKSHDGDAASKPNEIASADSASPASGISAAKQEEALTPGKDDKSKENSEGVPLSSITNAQSETKTPESSVSSVFEDKDSKTASSMKAYRVLIQSDSPDSIRSQISQTIARYEVISHAGKKEDPSLLGIEMPGGILFDGFVSVNKYKKFIEEISRTGNTKVIVTQARERPFADRARVKIWIQQY